MRFKIFSQLIVFILIITPTYAIFATAFNMVPVGEFANDKNEGDLIDENVSSGKSALDNYSDGNTWCEQDFERVKDWSDFVYMDNDSVELILGIEKAGFGAKNAIKDIIKTNKGKIVNEIWAKNELQAVVVDLPFPFVCSFVRETSLFISATFISCSFSLAFSYSSCFCLSSEYLVTSSLTPFRFTFISSRVWSINFFFPSSSLTPLLVCLFNVSLASFRNSSEFLDNA